MLTDLTPPITQTRRRLEKTGNRREPKSPASSCEWLMEILLKLGVCFFVKDYFLWSNWSSLYRSSFLETARKENDSKSFTGSLFEIKGFLLLFSFPFPAALLTQNGIRNQRQNFTLWFHTTQHTKAVWFRAKVFYQWSDCASRHTLWWRAVQQQHESLLFAYTVSPGERCNFLSWAVRQAIPNGTAVKLHLFYKLQFDSWSQKLVFI